MSEIKVRVGDDSAIMFDIIMRMKQRHSRTVRHLAEPIQNEGVELDKDSLVEWLNDMDTFEESVKDDMKMLKELAIQYINTHKV